MKALDKLPKEEIAKELGWDLDEKIGEQKAIVDQWKADF